MVDLRGERLPRISALCQSGRLIQLSSVLVRVLTVRSQRALRKSSYAQHRNLRIAVCAVVLISVSRSLRRQIDRCRSARRRCAFSPVRCLPCFALAAEIRLHSRSSEAGRACGTAARIVPMGSSRRVPRRGPSGTRSSCPAMDSSAARRSRRASSAITLPVGVGAYAAFALRAWLGRSISDRTRGLAKWSAICSFALGQVAYRLMAWAGENAVSERIALWLAWPATSGAARWTGRCR